MLIGANQVQEIWIKETDHEAFCLIMSPSTGKQHLAPPFLLRCTVHVPVHLKAQFRSYCAGKTQW